MKFCGNCGRAVEDNAVFCDACGTHFQEVNSNVNPIVGVTPKKKVINKRNIIISVILVVLIAVGAVAGTVIYNNQKEKEMIQQNIQEHEDNIEEVYNLMIKGAEKAEEYCSLESKVWYNCIREESSYETNKYTQNKYGRFYSDFNDALEAFRIGEKTVYDFISNNKKSVDNYIKDLKDCPEELEDEYKAIKEMYVAYSDMVDLAIGDSTYSWNTFNEALKNVKANFKSVKASAQMLVG